MGSKPEQLAPMAELHAQITAGETSRPPWWQKQGARYRTWLKQNGKSPVPTKRQASLRYPRTVVDSAFRSVDAKGFVGRSSGRMSVASEPITGQTSTNFSCGFNPWTVGATAPATGTPLGVHAMTGQDVSGDVLSWFKADIIANPSAFVLSLPGLGKSTLIRKQYLGAVAQGHVPIVAGDIKPEYVEITKAMVTADGRKGQVITLGHGQGHLNPLAAGALGSAIPVMEAKQAALAARGQRDAVLDDALTETRESVHSRQVTMVMALAKLIRGSELADFEGLIISASLRTMREEGRFSFEEPPLLADLVEFVRTGSEKLHAALFVEDEVSYRATVRRLVHTLESLTDGVLGQVFADHTTTPIDVTAPAVCIDVSAVSRGDTTLKAATLLACWSDAYGAMEAAHVLADVGLAPQRYFLAILDELWQVLGAGAGMVQSVDALTRLNRSVGTGLLLITHTGRDLEALPNEVDVKTAMGFIERAGMVICGGLPRGELDRLSNVLQFSSAEADLITSWSKGSPIERAHGGQSAPPLGRGKFLLKPSKDGSAGIPIQVVLTPTEIRTRIHDTNTRFRDLLDAEQRETNERSEESA